jgi:hypothetical protein
MKERPVLFSAAMVRALLARTKTQTRRVVKPQPEVEHGGEPYWFIGGYRAWPYRSTDDVLRKGGNVLPCPYGQPGDRLWVRESWQVARETLDYETGGEYDVWEWPKELGDPRLFLHGDARFGTKAGLFYAADGPDKNPGVFYDLTSIGGKTVLRPKEINWRPSIHMPRWASRITLLVTGVRVERLQDISEADALAEGVPNSLHLPGGRFARENFAHLWWTIHGDGAWEANPWVWAVEFKVLP